MELRDEYKELFGKYPSSQMKEENLIKKIEEKKMDLAPEVEEILVELEELAEPKEVVKMTTRQYNASKGLI